MSTGSCQTGELRCTGLNTTTLAAIAYCIPEQTFTCNHFESCECPFIHADPDIAGKGMIGAFMASATLALLASLVCLLLHPSTTQHTSNPFDRYFRRLLCAPLQRIIGASRADSISLSLFALITAISDQQLITGIAILGAAISSLHLPSMTVYHFNIITDMGWFSSNIHLLSLCVTRHFMDAPSLSYIPYTKAVGGVPRTLRIAAMLAMAVLLLYCATVSGYELWFERQNCPALCVRGGKRGGLPFKQMIVTWVFVVQSYTIQIVRLVPSVVRAWREGVVSWFEARDRGVLRQVGGRRGAARAYTVVRDCAVVLVFFFTSDFEFMLEMFAWYGLGMYWTFTDRAAGHRKMLQEDIRKENRVGFGQLVPMLLLTLSLLAFIEAHIYRPSAMERVIRKQKSLISTNTNSVDMKDFEHSRQASSIKTHDPH